MLKLGAEVVTDLAHVDVGFRDLRRFGFPFEPGHSIAGWPDNLGQILLGDETCGPMFSFLTTIPSRDYEVMPAHMHASDSWRVSLRGEFRMGNVGYSAGQFRLQRGWKNYPGDTYSIGPDGGWLALMFGDRRGMLMRLAQRSTGVPVVRDPAAAAAVPWVQATLGVDNDMFSDTTAEESAIVATLPEREQGWHINSSWESADDWELVDDGCRAAGILMGQKERGPLVLLVRTEAGSLASSACSFDTELLRLVVRGSAVIEGKSYYAGDARIELAGCVCPEVTAGPEGLDEVLVFGNRQGATPSRACAGWTSAVENIGQQLMDVLAG